MRQRRETACVCGVIRHKTCKGCGQTNLIWTGYPGHYRLADHLTKDVHTCAAFMRQPERVEATPIIDDRDAPKTDAMRDHADSRGIPFVDVDAIRQSVLETVRPEIERIAANAQRPVITINRVDAPTVTLDGHQHPSMIALLTLVMARKNVFLVGPAGTGKTTAAENVAGYVGLNFYPVSVGPATVEHALFGYMNAQGTYVPGHLFKPFTEGGLFLLDEFDSAHPGAVTAINAALANGYASFPHGVFAKHPDFVCIAAGNTYGNGADRVYVGRAQLDGATLDRFNFIKWDYDLVLEGALLAARVDAAQTPERAETVRQWGRYVYNVRAAVNATGVRMPVSTRSIIDGADAILAGMSIDAAADMRFWDRMSTDDAAKVRSRMGIS